MRQSIGEGEMVAVVSCHDQWGRRISLDERIWLTKIAIPGRIPPHCLSMLEEAIIDPDLVTHDKLHPDRECYYKAGILPVPQDRTYLKVVVEFDESDRLGETGGFVVTAFPVGRIHRQGTVKRP